MDGRTDGPTDGRTDGRMDGPTERPTDGRTDPLIETHLKNPIKKALPSETWNSYYTRQKQLTNIFSIPQMTLQVTSVNCAKEQISVLSFVKERNFFRKSRSKRQHVYSEVFSTWQIFLNDQIYHINVFPEDRCFQNR